jgi:hypothetical protein
MRSTNFLLSIAAAALLLALPVTAKADTYARFADTRLFCVVSSPANYLATIPVSGAVKKYTVKGLLKDSNKNKRKGQNAVKALKSKLQSAPKKRKAKIRAQIKATQFAVDLIKSIITFTKQCGDHVLDASASPFLPGGGGGKK